MCNAKDNVQHIIGFNQLGFDITKMVWHQTKVGDEVMVDDVDVFIAGQIIRTKGSLLPDYFEPTYSDDFKRVVMELGGTMRVEDAK